MEQEQAKTPKPLSFRFIFAIVGVILVLGVLTYLYYWYSSMQQTVQLARESLTKAQSYDLLTEQLNDEYRRCQQYISQEQGEFAHFEYCKRFINWVERTNDSL